MTHKTLSISLLGAAQHNSVRRISPTRRLSFSQTSKLLINWGLRFLLRLPCPPFLSGPDCGFRGREILAKLHHLAQSSYYSQATVGLNVAVNKTQGVRDGGVSRKPTSADSITGTSAAPHKGIFGAIPSALVCALARPPWTASGFALVNRCKGPYRPTTWGTDGRSRSVKTSPSILRYANLALTGILRTQGRSQM